MRNLGKGKYQFKKSQKKMDNSLISKNDMRRYFEEVFRLSETGEKFPVDFEKVWPLAYQRKHHAVRGLREDGIISNWIKQFVLNTAQ